MVLTTTVSVLNKAGKLLGKDEARKQDGDSAYPKSEKLSSDESRILYRRKCHGSMGNACHFIRPSRFIRSEFEKKNCFRDNASTDTQTRWKDLRTDLMLAPDGLNPERIGGDVKQEVQVHSGFLGPYDYVRIRIIPILKMAIAFGFGSPKLVIGDLRNYITRKSDSWRVVNHKDIIPSVHQYSVPRLMGYCHVAQPVYLTAGNIEDALMKGVRSHMNIPCSGCKHVLPTCAAIFQKGRSNYRTAQPETSQDRGKEVPEVRWEVEQKPTERKRKVYNFRIGNNKMIITY